MDRQPHKKIENIRKTNPDSPGNGSISYSESMDELQKADANN